MNLVDAVAILEPGLEDGNDERMQKRLCGAKESQKNRIHLHKRPQEKVVSKEVELAL